MIKGLKFGLGALLLFLAFASCKRTQKDGIIGPDAQVASSEFAILDSFRVFGEDRSLDYQSPIVSLSRPETTMVLVTRMVPSPDGGVMPETKEEPKISYKSRSTYFTAKFNEVVRWKIEISQDKPNPSARPYKLISGTSDHIDSIPEWTWDGSSDNQFYFTPGLTNFMFSVLGGKGKDSITITKNLINSRIIDSTSEGILINDFEGGIGITPFGDKNDLVSNPLPTLVDDIIGIPQGQKALLLYGNDHNGDYFVGGNQQTFKRGMLAGHDASDIYINMYIYGFPTNTAAGITPNATKIGIGVSQDNVNGNGEFNPAFEDTFDQQISVDWVGWKLISVKYSNLKRTTALLEGGNGPNKLQPETAVSIGCNILSSPNGNTVGAAMDYLIITFGKPLEK